MEGHVEKRGAFRSRGKRNLGVYVTQSIPRKVFLSLLILSLGLLIWLSLYPPSDGRESENALYEDKIDHVIAYFWLAMLVGACREREKNRFLLRRRR